MYQIQPESKIEGYLTVLRPMTKILSLVPSDQILPKILAILCASIALAGFYVAAKKEIFQSVIELSQSCLAIYHVLSTAFFKKNMFNNFLQKFMEIDQQLNNKQSTSFNYLPIYLTIGLIYSAMILLYIFRFIIFVKYITWTTILGYFSKIMVEYFLFTVVFLYCAYCKRIQRRFQLLNEQLKHVQCFLSQDINHQDVIFKQLLSFRKLYNKLAYMVIQLNSIFGCQVFFLFTVIVFAILAFVGQSTVEQASLIARAFKVVTVLICFILGILMAFVGDAAGLEAKLTANVCYNLLLNYPTSYRSTRNLALKEQLTLLAKQSTYKCPYLSAYGFLTINRRVLISIFAFVTIYVIAIVQLSAFPNMNFMWP